MNDAVIIALLVIGGIGLGWSANEYLREFAEPEPTCEEMAIELWAFRQCLTNRPACSINGPKSYASYHETRHRFEEQCGEDRGDAYLSQIK